MPITNVEANDFYTLQPSFHVSVPWAGEWICLANAIVLALGLWYLQSWSGVGFSKWELRNTNVFHLNQGFQDSSPVSSCWFTPWPRRSGGKIIFPFCCLAFGRRKGSPGDWASPLALGGPRLWEVPEHIQPCGCSLLVWQVPDSCIWELASSLFITHPVPVSSLHNTSHNFTASYRSWINTCIWVPRTSPWGSSLKGFDDEQERFQFTMTFWDLSVSHL